MKKSFFIASAAIVLSLGALLAFLAPLPASAATTATVAEIKVGATFGTFTIDLVTKNDGTGVTDDFIGKVMVSCVGPATGDTHQDTGIPTSAKPTEYIASCTGLKGGTLYNYTIASSDGKGFPAVKSSFTTEKADATQTTGGESYELSGAVDKKDLADGTHSAEAAIKISHPIRDVNYIAQIGRTSDNGATCYPDEQYDTSPKYSEIDSLTITNTWKLPVGTYCIGVKKETAPLSGTYVLGQQTIAVFTISTTNVAPSGTDLGTPNAYGCTSTSTQTYCMLAPLPGIGKIDAQGNLTGEVDVSGDCAAADGTVSKHGALGCYLKGLIRLIMGLIGGLAVVMIMVGGIEYMTGTSIGEKEGGMKRLNGALLGLLVALGSYTILNTINPNLVDLTITIPNATLDLEPTAGIGVSFPPGATATAVTAKGSSTGSATGPTDVTANISTYDKQLSDAATAYGVECTWLKALMYRESGGDPLAKSSAGAIGLMQMTPDTWNALGFKDSTKWTDPTYAANASAAYIKKLKTTGCNNSATGEISGCNMSINNYANGYMAAAYNGGPGVNDTAVDCKSMTKWECTVNQGGLVETATYVNLVTNNYQKLKSTPGWGC